MAWVKTASNKSVIIRATVEQVTSFLVRVEECGRLMPDVVRLEQVGPNIYHYQLSEFSNGAIRFTPDYESCFDLSDPNNITWQPSGQHNFRSWGAFHMKPGPVLGEVVLQIDTRAEASVDVEPILLPVVQPFAKVSSDRVTEEFLQRIKAYIETSRDSRSH